MYRHHPQWRRARQIVGRAGSASCGRFSHFLLLNDEPGNIRNQAGSGAAR